MNNINLINSINGLKKYHHIDGITFMTILKYSIRNTLVKKYNLVEYFDIFIDYENGSIDIWRNRIVVNQIQDTNSEINISFARQIEFDFNLREEITEQFTLKFLNRKNILIFKENFYLKNKEYSTIWIYNHFKMKIGDIVFGQIFHIKKDMILRNTESKDLFLPKKEQMFNDFMRKKESIRAVIKNVYWGDIQPIIILSRTTPNFIKKLFEQEIPEILDGFILVKQVVRIPGEKTKISVESSDPYIDPVRTCLGIQGHRIQSIVKELKTENIDVIKYSENIIIYIIRVFSPTKISFIEINEKINIIMISLKESQIARAIGKKGKNIRLASKITGYKIYIIRYYYHYFNKNKEEFIQFEYSLISNKGL